MLSWPACTDKPPEPGVEPRPPRSLAATQAKRSATSDLCHCAIKAGRQRSKCIRSLSTSKVSHALVKLHCDQRSADLMGLLGQVVRPSVCLSAISFYLIFFFSVNLGLILMKLGMNDTKARSYKATEQIFNICINYQIMLLVLIRSKGSTKYGRAISAERQ